MRPACFRLMLMPVPVALIALTAVPDARADLVFATWNIAGGEESPGWIRRRAEMLEEKLGEIDILVLQEVVSEEQVAEIADGLGLSHCVISDFSPPVSVTGKWHESLEVAVVSRLPIERPPAGHRGRDAVVGDRQRQLRPAHLPPRAAERGEGLRARDLIGQVSIDIQQRRTVRSVFDNMGVPDFLVERTHQTDPRANRQLLEAPAPRYRAPSFVKPHRPDRSCNALPTPAKPEPFLIRKQIGA